ncbi:MAG: sugar ABC transporter ATP-binding protein [Protaetiibacter sp.]
MAVTAPAAVSAVDVARVSKSFGGVHALRNVSLDVPQGSATAIVGENGAGKSTLMSILAGLAAPDGGQVVIAGREVRRFAPREALAHGVGLVPQEITLAEDRTVAENLLLGREGKWFVSPTAMARRAGRALAEIGVRLPVDAVARSLGISDRQMLVIARALITEARILILDEPTASLTPAETRVLLDLLHALLARGITILYVSHRLPEIFELSQFIHVMRDGELVLSTPTGSITPDGLVRAMVGRELPARRERQAARAPQRERLVVEGLQWGALRDARLAVRSGEVVGVAGLPGSGREELLPAIFGAFPARGSVTVDGTSVRRRSVGSMIAAGVVYVPGERKSAGIFADLDITRNITTADLSEFSRWGLVRVGALARTARSRIRDFNVKATPGVSISTLSGGNQQKVILARWLSGTPSVILLDDPTRGVDVGSKAEIHQRILESASEGAAVLIASTDLPELLSLADRILVMSGGRVATELSADEATEEAIMRAAAGLAIDELRGPRADTEPAAAARERMDE